MKHLDRLYSSYNQFKAPELVQYYLCIGHSEVTCLVLHCELGQCCL